MSPTPKFQPGETMNIVRYIPPLPKGATVTVKRIEYRGDEYQYVVEGRRIPQGDLIEVWADEIDLKVPLVFEAPRKKRRGSREMPSYPLTVTANTATPESTSVSGNGSATVNGTTPAAAAPRVRRSRKVTEPIGIIPTRTGRSNRSRALESALYAERPEPKVERGSSPALKQETKSAPTAAQEKTRQRRSRVATDQADTVQSVAIKETAAQASGPTAEPRRKRSADTASVVADTPAKKRTAATRARNASGKAVGTTKSEPATVRKPKAAASRSDTPTARKPTATKVARPEKPLKAAPKKRRKKKGSAEAAAAGKARKVDLVRAGVVSSPTKRSRSVRDSGIEAPVSLPVKRTRSSQQRAASSVGEIIDGVLTGQAIPGGMMFGGGTAAPVIIIIINAGMDGSMEPGRKRRS